jgi:hypothetical protein
MLPTLPCGTKQVPPTQKKKVLESKDCRVAQSKLQTRGCEKLPRVSWEPGTDQSVFSFVLTDFIKSDVGPARYFFRFLYIIIKNVYFISCR